MHADSLFYNFKDSKLNKVEQSELERASNISCLYSSINRSRNTQMTDTIMNVHADEDALPTLTS
jgi:hypothetical protein